MHNTIWRWMDGWLFLESIFRSLFWLPIVMSISKGKYLSSTDYLIFLQYFHSIALICWLVSHITNFSISSKFVQEERERKYPRPRTLRISNEVRSTNSNRYKFGLIPFFGMGDEYWIVFKFKLEGRVDCECCFSCSFAIHTNLLMNKYMTAEWVHYLVLSLYIWYLRSSWK